MVRANSNTKSTLHSSSLVMPTSVRYTANVKSKVFSLPIAGLLLAAVSTLGFAPAPNLNQEGCIASNSSCGSSGNLSGACTFVIVDKTQRDGACTDTPCSWDVSLTLSGCPSLAGGSLDPGLSGQPVTLDGNGSGSISLTELTVECGGPKKTVELTVRKSNGAAAAYRCFTLECSSCPE